MKIVESKDLVVGRKYCTELNRDLVLEFVEHNPMTCGSYFKYDGEIPFKLNHKGLVGFTSQKKFIELENQ